VSVHELNLLVDVIVLWSNRPTSRSALGIFSGKNDETESGRGWERADIGDAGAGLQELDVRRRVDMGMYVHNGGFRGGHFASASCSDPDPEGTGKGGYITARDDVGQGWLFPIRNFCYPAALIVPRFP